jgi:hypothetical protein
MMSRTVVYEDYTDAHEIQTEVHWFNISMADFARLEVGTKNGLMATVQAMVDAKDNAEILAMFDKLVSIGYGVRLENGKLFDQDPKHFKRFKDTGAYNALFLDLLKGGANDMAEFVSQIVPQAMAEEMAKEMAKREAEEAGTAVVPTRPVPQDHLTPKSHVDPRDKQIEHDLDVIKEDPLV